MEKSQGLVTHTPSFSLAWEGHSKGKKHEESITKEGEALSEKGKG